jgi:ABC-type transporter Mla subunit MlaD
VADTRGTGPLGIGPVLAGRIMVGIGIVGVVASLIGTIVAQQLVRDFHDALVRSLDLTADVLDTVDESIVVADDAVRIIGVGVHEAERAVRSLGGSMHEGQRALDAVVALTGGNVADALDDIDRALPSIERAADTIEDTLTALGSLPFAPAYDPDQRLGRTIGDLRAGLAGLPEELRGQAEQVERASGQLADATAGAIATADALAELDERLDDVADLIRGYAGRTADASELVDTQRTLLAGTAARARVVIVTFGVLFALGQFVPVYLGLGLMRDGEGAEARAELSDRA